MFKHCPRCTIEKHIEEFGFNAARKDGRQVYCLECMRSYNKTKRNRERENAYLRNKRQNDPEWAARDREYHNAWARKVRNEVLEAYSDGKVCCSCCGEDNDVFLAVDHINGGGSEEKRQRKGAKIYGWLRSRKFPPGYQVLCHNCNYAKHILGACVHRESAVRL